MPWISIEGTRHDLPDNHLVYAEEGEIAKLLHAAAVVLPFAGPTDGRAFSWCGQLRQLGYQRPVAAGGEIGLDRAAYAFRCGFTLVWLTDQEAELCQPIHLAPFRHSYQPTLDHNG